MKILLTLLALTISMGAFAQGRGGAGQGGGRVQALSIPINVLRKNLPLDAAKLDLLEADLKVLQGVSLPLEAVGELKLTVDQKKKLEELAKEMQSSMRDSNDRIAVRESFVPKVKAVLTAEQIKVVEKYPAPRFGGGQGGGRGQGRPGGPPKN
jgi:hypothetical protein